MRNLQAAIPLMDQLGQSAAGPGSDAWNKAKAGLITLGIVPANATDAEIRQETNKYLHRVVQDLPSANRSDAAQSLADVSNPSLDTNLNATRKLARSALAFSRMDSALPIIYDKRHPGAAAAPDYTSAKSKWYQSQDPRAYSFDTDSYEDQQKTLKEIGPPVFKDNKGKETPNPAYQKFRNSLQSAHDAGFLTPLSPGATP
jgi:hypothetical protein